MNNKIAVRKKGMGPLLSARTTFLVTLAFIAEFFPTTKSFSLVSGNGTPQHRCGRIRPRACLSQSRSCDSQSERIADKPEEGWSRVVPLPKKGPRWDAEVSSVDLPAYELNAGKEMRGREDSTLKHSRGGTSQPGHTIRTAGGKGEVRVPTVRQLLSRENVSGAISVLMSAVKKHAAKAADGNLSADDSNGTLRVSNALPEDVLLQARADFKAVLAFCAERGLWRKAKHVLSTHMPVAGIETSEAEYLLAIDACAKAREPEEAISFLHEMRMRGFETDKSAYSAAVLACNLSGNLWRAVFLLRDAKKRGVSLPPPDIASMVRAMTQEGPGWQQALDFYELFLQLSVELGQEFFLSKVAQGLDGHTDYAIDGVGSFDDEGDDLLSSLEDNKRKLPVHLPSGFEHVCQAALEACTVGGKWEKALEILDVLRTDGGEAKLSSEAYNEAIQACGNGDAWKTVLFLVAEMRENGLSITPAAFETALKGCAAMGSWSRTRSLLRSMADDTAEGIPLNISHYLKALRTCTAVVNKPGSALARSAATAASELLQDVREAGWLKGEQGEEAYVAAIGACIPAQDAWSALALLDSAEDDGVQRSVALRTAAMQACLGAGEWQAALCILKEMQEEGLQPDNAAYVAGIAACSDEGLVDLALELLDKLLVENPGDQATVTAGYQGAISACAHNGHWERATSLLQRMRQDPLAVVSSKEYNVAILACCRAQMSVAALTLLGDMTLEGAGTLDKHSPIFKKRVKPNATSYTRVIQAFGKERRWQTVMELLQSMKEDGSLQPKASTYNVIMAALCKAKQWKQALQLLSEMKREGIRPTKYTYTLCIKVCGISGQLDHTLSLMAAMREEKSLSMDPYIYSTVMKMYARVGRWDDAVKVLQEMRDEPEEKGPILFNYNHIFGILARARRWEELLKEMDNMRSENIVPVEITFFKPLSSCRASKNLPMALTLLDRMRGFNLKPGVVPFGSAIAAALGVGDTAAANLLLDEMEKGGTPPTVPTYKIAIMACRDAAKPDAAVDLLRRMQKQGLRPDSVIVYFVVQTCSCAGDLERGLKLIAEMEASGFVPSCSFYNRVLSGITANFSSSSS